MHKQQTTDRLGYSHSNTTITPHCKYQQEAAADCSVGTKNDA